MRIRSLALGNPGDAKPVGNGVSGLGIHYGPGYRIYFARNGDTVIILLGGGDKSKRAEDIRVAQALTD